MGVDWIEWSGGDTPYPLDCYDCWSTCSANKDWFQSFSSLLRFVEIEFVSPNRMRCKNVFVKDNLRRALKSAYNYWSRFKIWYLDKIFKERKKIFKLNIPNRMLCTWICLSQGGKSWDWTALKASNKLNTFLRSRIITFYEWCTHFLLHTVISRF